MTISRSDGERIIDLLGLKPIPIEGGLFHQTWCMATDDAIAAGTVIGTAIYGALTDDPESFSAMHRLTGVEIWHFYAGDPIRLLLLHPDGVVNEPILGPDLLGGQHPQVIVPAGTWMGGDLVTSGTFALFGTTMSPGFTDGSFENGGREHLMAGWPAATERIVQLTRPGTPRRLPGNE